MLIVLFAISLQAFSQDEVEKTHKFRKDNIFIGGGIGLSIGGWSGGFNASANPEIGYTVAEWFDAGISTNFNYYSYSAEFNEGYRQHSFNYGGGVFARLYPYRGFFVQILPEYNRINTNLKYMPTGEEFNLKQEAPSLLLGAGYGTRMVGQSNFYTVIMFDAGNNTNSPYVDSYGGKLPILRAGFNFYLRPSKK